MTSDIRKMQSFVLNLQDFSGSFPDGGWGINIDKSVVGGEFAYRLFADVSASGTGKQAFNAGDGVKQNVDLPGGVVIGKIDLDGRTAKVKAEAEIGDKCWKCGRTMTTSECSNGCDQE